MTKAKVYEDQYVRFPLRPGMSVKSNLADQDAVSYSIKTRKDEATAFLQFVAVTPEAGQLPSEIAYQDHSLMTCRPVQTALTVNRPEWQEKAFEVYVKRNDQTRYGWRLMLPVGKRAIWLVIDGAGDHVRGESIWRELVEQLVVKQPIAPKGDVLRQHDPQSTLFAACEAEREEWPSAAETLPLALLYLQTAVQRISWEDAAALDSGTCDISYVAEALNAKYADVQGKRRMTRLIADAEALEEWSNSLPVDQRILARAAAFVAGVLRGAAEFIPDGEFS